MNKLLKAKTEYDEALQHLIETEAYADSVDDEEMQKSLWRAMVRYLVSATNYIDALEKEKYKKKVSIETLFYHSPIEERKSLQQMVVIDIFLPESYGEIPHEVKRIIQDLEKLFAITLTFHKRSLLQSLN